MTYASKGLIQAADYNTLVWGTANGVGSNSVNCLYRLWGVGAGQYGLGQDMSTVPLALDINPTVAGTQSTGELYSVDSTNFVSAVQWSGLIGALNRALYHQQQGNVTVGGLQGVRTGDTVSVVSGLTAALGSVANGTGTGRVSTLVATSTPGYNWSFASTGTVQQAFPIERQLTFTSGEAARYFFNAGGIIRATLSAQDNTGGVVPRSAAMARCINQVGSINISANTNSGVATNNLSLGLSGAGKGYWQLPLIGSSSGDYALGFLGGYQGDPTPGSVYTDDHCYVYAGVSGDTGPNGGRGSALRVAVALYSGFGTASDADSMNITVNLSMNYFAPLSTSGGGTLIASWGTPSASIGPLSV